MWTAVLFAAGVIVGAVVGGWLLGWWLLRGIDGQL
jgi:hypothetical protein